MKARLKKELGQTGGLVSVFGELFVAQERHRGLVGSAQAWMQGMPELSSEIWQLGLLVHCGLLAPDSLAAGQKSPIQLILQQILKNSFNGLGREGGSAADLPSVSLPARHSCSERTLSLGVSRLAEGCQEVFGGPRPWAQQRVLAGANTQESQGSASIPRAAARGRAGSSGTLA